MVPKRWWNKVIDFTMNRLLGTSLCTLQAAAWGDGGGGLSVHAHATVIPFYPVAQLAGTPTCCLATPAASSWLSASAACPAPCACMPCC